MLRVPNTALWWVLGSTSALLTVVLLVPTGQRIFHFAPIHPDDLLWSLGAGLVCVLWFEVLKLRHRLASSAAESIRAASDGT